MSAPSTAETTTAETGGAPALAGPGDDEALAARLRMAVTRLHRRLRQQAGAGLTPSQASALAGVEALGSPTLGALAARESVQPPSMTRIVTALEERGLVARVADAEDRRVARLTLTAAGAAVLGDIRSVKDAYLADALHRLGPDERAGLAALTGLLERLADAGGDPGATS